MLIRSPLQSSAYLPEDTPSFNAADAFQNMLDAMDRAIGLIDQNYVLLYSNQTFNGFMRDEDGSHIGEELQLSHLISHRKQLKIHSSLLKRRMWTGIIQIHGRVLKVRISRVDLSNLAGEGLASNAYFMITASDHSHAVMQQKELSHANKVADKLTREKSEFLSQTGHELRTPLNAVLGFAQLLQSGTGLSVEQEDYVSEIMQASNYLLSVINQILNMSKADHDHTHLKLLTQRIDSSTLIEECIALVNPLAKKANVTLLQSDFKAYLSKDKVRLKQVLLNLISNAIKYNHEGGAVVIQGLHPAPHFVRIEVQDSGNGIAAHLLKTIFNPFERLGIQDGQIEGSGIGLMITRRLVKLMNGSAHVVSQPSQGSVFTLDFPIREGQLDPRSTLLAGTIRDIVWVGERCDSQQFAERLTSLRPACEFLVLSNLPEVAMYGAGHAPFLLFVALDELLSEFASLSERDQNLLKRIPLVVVVRSDSSILELRALGLCFVAQMPSHFTAIEFMEIVDNQAYR